MAERDNMNTFKQFITGLVAKAQVELEAEERADKALGKTQVHKDIDYLADMYNRMEKLNRDITSTTVNVMSGYENKYMSKNDFRFAHKTYHKSDSLDNTDYFDYLLSTQGIEETTVRERKIVTESYDFDLGHMIDELPWKKVTKKATPSKAKVKQVKTLPQASYVPSKPSASTTKYTPNEILTQDGKPIKSTTFNFYKVVDYKIYKLYVVLDLVAVESQRDKKYFDDEIIGMQQESIDHSRDEIDDKEIFSHLVFKFEPIGKDGKPNPYCGLLQLQNWLKSQEFINRMNPATLKQALDILKGSTVSIPNAFAYNFTSVSKSARIIERNGKKVFKCVKGSSDDLTVFTVFGDFETFRECMTNEKFTYTKHSDYFEKDKDKDGKLIPETYENYNTEVYAKISTGVTPVIISYDCHKEFSTPLPLEYSHIGYIFD